MTHEVTSSEIFWKKDPTISLPKLEAELARIDGLHYAGYVCDTKLEELDDTEDYILFVGAKGRISSLRQWGEFTEEVANSFSAEPVEVSVPDPDPDKPYREPGTILLRERLGIKEEKYILFETVSPLPSLEKPWKKVGPTENTFEKAKDVIRNLSIEVWPDVSTADMAFTYRTEDFDLLDEKAKREFARNMNSGDHLSNRFFDRISKGIDPFNPPPSRLKSIVTFGRS